jgi:dTMP kinase
MNGLLISFEGSEGCGKSTQIGLLTERLRAMGHRVCLVREPGGTPTGEEIRETLKHSKAACAMTPETELLLMNASRAQLVREVIRPALGSGEIVLCDRFYDSTTVYQGYGRGLDLKLVGAVVDFAVGDTKPALTLLLQVPAELSAQRLAARQSSLPFVHDRIESAGQEFFERVSRGYAAIAAAEPDRIKVIDGGGSLAAVAAEIWKQVELLLAPKNVPFIPQKIDYAGRDKMIEDTLAKIEARLESADAVKEDKRRELQDLLARLKSEVAELSKTHAEQAESIAGFTEISTREATRGQQNPQLLKLSLDGLSSSVEEFERSHPKLVQIVNNFSNTLSNLGI